MLSLESALERLLAQIKSLPQETVPLSSAAGRYLALPACAVTDLPAFDNSAMDGYAVLSADTNGTSRENPRWLRVTGQIPAGEAPSGQVTSGAAIRIFTGSAMPAGADAVVMQEDTFTDPARPGEVAIVDGVKPWENVRFQGEDVKRGQSIVPVGSCLGAPQLAVLSATGIGRVTVSRRPIVGLLATGNELIEPGQPLQPGQIYESNRLMLATLLARWGVQTRVYPIVADSLTATNAALAKAFAECDVVVTSGGVSVGSYDFVKDALVQLGGKLDFWRVAIKPGKPFLFGTLGEKILSGLPGNPVSAYVTATLLLRPALLRMQGVADVTLPSVLGQLAEPVMNRGDRRHFVRVHMDGAGQVRLAGLQASHQLHSLAGANALLDVPPETTLPAGAQVRVYPE